MLIRELASRNWNPKYKWGFNNYLTKETNKNKEGEGLDKLELREEYEILMEWIIKLLKLVMEF